MMETPASDQLESIANCSDASLTDFITAVIQEFEGPANFAREVVHEYQQLPEGSAAKARLLGLLLSVWAKHGVTSESDDLESMEAEAARLEKELKAGP